MSLIKPAQLASGSYNITGSLFGTSSFANSSSYALTASYALNGGSGGSGFPFSGSAVITGSLLVTAGITGSLQGTASYALTASTVTNLGSSNYTQSFTNQSTWTVIHNLNTRYVIVQTFDTNYDEMIPQNIDLTDSNTVTITFPTLESGTAVVTVGGALQNASPQSASYALTSVSASYASTASYVVTSQTASYVVTSQTASYYNGTVTSASYASTASYVVTSQTASYYNTNNLTTTGFLRVTGSLIVTGSTQGNVVALTISSNTASLDLTSASFYTLQLVQGTDTYINPSNIQAGTTSTLLVSTTGSATVSFPSIVKQPSGSSYTPTTTTGKDILTFISYDSSTLYLANVKNLV